MQFWFDGTNFSAIEEIRECGLLHGVTTNPSLLARANASPQKTVNKLLDIQPGPVAVQVTGVTSDEMIEEAKELYDLSARIIVKIPSTKAGYQAIFRLTHARIPTMATAIVDPLQALFAAKAGASYLALYLSHAQDRAEWLLSLLPTMIKTFQFECRILAASIHSQSGLLNCLKSGIDAVTLKEDLFHEILITPAIIEEALSKFEEDWHRLSSIGKT